jgi:phosphodiesterase/alkaline phosphatase D-like protein
VRAAFALAGLSTLVVAAGVASVAASAPAPFAQGVAAGEITSSSALLWTRAPSAGRVAFTVECRVGARLVRLSGAARATATSDRTVSVPARRLPSGATCTYRFAQGARVSPTGRFKTAPAATADARVRFAFTGDADATPGADGKPGFNGFETYARMAAERNDFNVNLGDTIYSDSEVAGARPALTALDKWAKYRLGLALAPLRTLRASAGLYSHWDDHEFINDFTREENGQAIYDAGAKAFRDYAPVTIRPGTGLYRTFRWGRNVELFFLDERSFRSGKVGRQCNGDLAPTAPVAVRTAFAALAPPLAQPVPTGCLDAINDPSRTMLGTAQYDAFVTAIKASTATWKVVLNEVPLMQFYALPYDRWEGYAAERTRLLAELVTVQNVVVLTTDLHGHLIGEIRSSTLAPTGPIGTGIWEVVTGPVATNTYAKEIDAVLGAKGTGDFVTSLFLKPQPPAGIGLRCAATDAFGYAQVTATRATLTVTPKAAAGGPVREKTGGVCAPLVLQAR